MKIKEMKSILATNKFDNYECNFKLKTGKPKVTLEDLMNEIIEIKKDIKSINYRIDKLEELVVDQFKEHGWIN